MIIFPAIDIKGGQCVRLIQGRSQDATVYSSDPVEMARQWVDAGAEYIHVVDLDGAFTGVGANLQAVKGICGCGVPVQLGGGIRKMKDVETRFELGVQRVILGTSAIKDPEFVASAAKKYPGRIVAGLDAVDGKIAVSGWVETEEISPQELALKLLGFGIDTCVFTDISRDGMLTGPNYEATAELGEKTGMRVIASGGVGCLRDIIRLRDMDVYGAIIGKALYDKRVDLRDALNICEGEQL